MGQSLLVVAVIVVASVVVVVVSAVGVGARGSNSGSAHQEVASVTGPATTAASTSTGSTATPSRRAERSGPPNPAVAVAYPFDLYEHCGIREVAFAGHQWLASPPAPEPRRLPDAQGITDYTGYVAGTMTLLPEDQLRFTITDPLSSGNGQSFLFRPQPATTQPLPPCA